MRRILVTSNCQTAGLAASLRYLMSDATIEAKPMPWPDQPALEDRLVDESIARCDLWLTSRTSPRIESRLADRRRNPPRIVIVPTIHFRAFHPDLVYVKSTRTGELTRYHYNSAIVAWCYQNGIARDVAVRLFESEVFETLGYFSAWSSSVAESRQLFLGTCVDFDTFFLAAKREVPFMHSINHPTQRCMVALGRLVAASLGEDTSRFDWAARIPDSLAHLAWPLYPPIAERFGTSGEYSWWIDQKRISGVREFVEFAYHDYESNGLDPSDLEICDTDARRHRVLTSFAAERA